MGRLDGKVAIITGAAMGMGALEAKMFAKEGARVVATDLQEEKLKEVVGEINEKGGKAIAVKHDVASEAGWKEVVKQAVDAFGKVNVLVNNAGIVIQKNAEQITLDEWNKLMDINLTGNFLGIKYVIPEMRKAGGGSIINISSVSGIIGIGGAAYNASKGGNRTLTKNVAVDFAKDNIRVNSVHPGVIATTMTQSILADKEQKAYLESITPLPRLGKPEDIANGVLFLASDESSFMTGSELVIDGGLLAK